MSLDRPIDSTLDRVGVNLTLRCFYRCQLTWHITLISLALDPILFLLLFNSQLRTPLTPYYSRIVTLLGLTICISLLSLFRDSLLSWAFEIKKEGQRLIAGLASLAVVSTILTVAAKVTGALFVEHPHRALLQGGVVLSIGLISLMLMKLAFRHSLFQHNVRINLSRKLTRSPFQIVEAQAQEMLFLWTAPIVCARLVPALGQALIIIAGTSTLWYWPCLTLASLIIVETKPSIRQFLRSCKSCGRVIPSLGIRSDHCIDCRHRRSRNAISHEVLVASKSKPNKTISALKRFNDWLIGSQKT
jgi:hypothetical protein